MESDLISIIKAKFIPKPESNPNRPPDSENFAENEETVKKVLGWITQYYDAFKGQSARTKLEESMDTADEMMRVSHYQDQLDADEADNKDKTKTKLSSPTFYRYTRTITAWENSVLLGSHKELPVICEPMPGAAGIREDEAKAQADYRNIELEYVFDKAKLRDKVSDWNFFANKYANIFIEAFYNRTKEERWERKPKTGMLEEIRIAMGRKRGTSWKKAKKIITDWPDFRMHDLRNVIFDHSVTDFSKQSCVGWREQLQYSDICDMYKRGEIKNFDKLKLEHQYNIDAEDDTLTDRKANADESNDGEVTKLWDVWTFWIRVPVDEKGEWNPDETVPSWHRVILIGNPSTTSLCGALEHDPMKQNRIPGMLWHIKRDDKGALNMGNIETTSALIQMESTLLNLTMENMRERTRKPWIMERGSINIRDNTFSVGGNRIWVKQPGAANPQQVEIQDTTQYCVPLLKVLDDRIRDVFGVNNPFLAEALGGRTSATEAGAVSEQSVKLALEDLIYKANQLLPWMASWTFDLLDMFSDPDTVLTITKADKPVEVKPTEVWGPVNIRITSIKTFQDSLTKRKDFLQYLNQVVPVLIKYISRKGIADIAEQVSRPFGLEHVKSWFDIPEDYDARNIARSENQYILWEGMSILPKDGENDEVHLSEHEPILASYILLPPEQQVPENIQKMKLHVQMTRNKLEQKAQSSAAPQGAPQPQQAPEAPGQEMAAEMGAQENMPAPEMPAEGAQQ